MIQVVYIIPDWWFEWLSVGFLIGFIFGYGIFSILHNVSFEFHKWEYELGLVKSEIEKEKS